MWSTRCRLSASRRGCSWSPSRGWRRFGIRTVPPARLKALTARSKKAPAATVCVKVSAAGQPAGKRRRAAAAQRQRRRAGNGDDSLMATVKVTVEPVPTVPLPAVGDAPDAAIDMTAGAVDKRESGAAVLPPTRKGLDW